MAETAVEEAPAESKDRTRFVLELVVVILLGIASVATAYASFQSSLYDSVMAGEYTRGQNAKTEAESLYLEANQQYVQDAATYSQLLLLQVDAQSEDEVTAADAAAKLELFYTTSVDDALAAAIAESEATGIYPLDSDEYLAARFGAYEELQAEAEARLASGDQANGFGDRLTLFTVLFAVALFLFGIAAVVNARLIKWVLIGIGGGITAVAIVFTAFVPFTAVG